MKRILLSALLGTVLAGSSYAGVKVGGQVTVNASAGSGNVGDARRSASAYEQIGCSTYGYAGAASGYTYCWAVDYWNKSVACASTDANIVRAAAAITSFSFISFQLDKNGACTSLDVQNRSSLTPMVP